MLEVGIEHGLRTLTRPLLPIRTVVPSGRRYHRFCRCPEKCLYLHSAAALLRIENMDLTGKNIVLQIFFHGFLFVLGPNSLFIRVLIVKSTTWP